MVFSNSEFLYFFPFNTLNSSNNCDVWHAIKIKKASVTSGKALNLVEEAELSEPEEVLSIDAEESSDDTADNSSDLNDKSVDQSAEVPSEDSNESEDADEDPQEEK